MTSKAEILGQLPLFRGLDRSHIQSLSSLGRFVSLKSGQFVCRQGEPGRDLFVIVSGSVVVRQGDRIIARLDAGDVVGELAILDEQSRSADVVANEPARLLKIDGAGFSALLEANPDNHQARYDLALALLAGEDREGAGRRLSGWG